MDRFIVWLAEGFGSGRAKVAPGTFGSIVGIAWFALLAWPRSLPLYALGIVVSSVACVWICGRAEKIMRQSDPGSIVLDEIVAVPLCFAAWMLGYPGALPSLFSAKGLLLLAGGFALFRLFDIAKPWPVGTSQNLAGGLGVTVDDLLAALYVNGVWLAGGWVWAKF